MSALTGVSQAEQRARNRLANNGRNTDNSNAGIRVGSDLHLCEMLLAEIDWLRDELQAVDAAFEGGEDHPWIPGASARSSFTA